MSGVKVPEIIVARNPSICASLRVSPEIGKPTIFHAPILFHKSMCEGYFLYFQVKRGKEKLYFLDN